MVMPRFKPFSGQEPKAASPASEQKPPLDLSHHYSRVTKARQESNIKAFYKYFAIPGIGNLAGGLPNASYFPYDTLQARVALPDRFEPTSTTSTTFSPKSSESRIASEPFARIVVPRESSSSDPSSKIDITTALQYGQASGYPPLLSFVRQFTRENLHPNVPYAGGPEVILTNGALDGLSKAIECLSNPWDKTRDWVSDREGVLCEEFSFMSSIQSMRPRGLQIVPVKVDLEGMLPSGPGGLEDVLENWDISKGKRPHLMYTITIGQNPTSGILSVERRKEIYSICTKYDVVIIEDDPYWHLQYPSAASSEAFARNLPRPAPVSTISSSQKSSGFPFLDSLVPSYLSMDTDGRVVRLDTFSKSIAPGCRLGWVTAQPKLIERLLRITEGTTQNPSGFVQAMVAQVIMGPQSNDRNSGPTGWKVDGWVRWLEGLRGNYERRMQIMSAVLEEGKFTIQQKRMANDEDAEWAVVKKAEMYNFCWPRGGMFLWLRYNFDSHPLVGQVDGPRLAKALWVWLTRKPYLALVMPGEIFDVVPGSTTSEGWRFCRICFAAVEEEDVQKVSVGFTRGVESFWHLRKVKDIEGIEAWAASEDREQQGVTDLGAGWAC
ncbi:hypothetical protein V501_10627 [Pseudogymnoascus sp. VKM F-4519 (FW-2642)]|nr:hypothetical protein V501_10627 [Pseudogymnoascus sp. VKM F-4519 (FW-2642)]